MGIVRRVYLYGVAYIALLTLIGGLMTLVSTGLGDLIESGSRPSVQTLSLGLATALVGGLFWATHWLLAQRFARRDAADQTAALRALFLYGTLFTLGIGVLLASYSLLEQIFRLGLDQRETVRVGGRSVVAELVRTATQLVIIALFWVYHRTVLARDRRAAPEASRRATLRRWYLYATSGLGLTVLIVAAISSLRP